MCVHESGRISVNINGYIVDMNVSIPVRYQQQVATIDESSVNLLGNVKHRLVLTPRHPQLSIECLLQTIESLFIARFFKARRRISL